MSFQSLKSLKDLEKSVTKTGTNTGPKKFFTVQSGQSYRIRFRQELTEDSKNYNDETGTAINVPVITSPINWKWRVASTAG